MTRDIDSEIAKSKEAAARYEQDQLLNWNNRIAAIMGDNDLSMRDAILKDMADSECEDDFLYMLVSDVPPRHLTTIREILSKDA